MSAMVGTATRERAETSASDSSGNSTSIYQYPHEPWESFQQKVYTLASHIFPDANVKDIEIQRMRGGSSNRVVGIAIHTPSPHGLIQAVKNGLHRLLVVFDFLFRPPRPVVSHYILRIPRWGNEHMQRHLGTLNFANNRLHVPVPTTVVCGLSSDNVLRARHTLQNRLRGESLQFAFSQLSFAQRKDLMRKICEVILRMHESSYGDCASVVTYNIANSGCEMQSLAIPPGLDNDDKVYSLPVGRTSDTVTFIKAICQRWKDHEKTFLRKPKVQWDHCSEMAQEMADRGFLNTSERFHFTHMDLYPRNILVNTTDETSIEITRILDWDDVIFAPKYMACRAPFRLWEGEDEMDESDEYEGLKEPQTPELQEIKALFERLVGHDFLTYAYKEEYILLRLMSVVLQMGLGYSHLYDELETILDRWAELRQVHNAAGVSV